MARANHFTTNLLLLSLLAISSLAFADAPTNVSAAPTMQTTSIALPQTLTTSQPSAGLLQQHIPKPPHLRAKAFVLMDYTTGQVIAEKNQHDRLAPASLTKMMTLYIISQALASGQINLHDKVHISKKAWRMGGSKMFIREGTWVKVSSLIQGVIVDSGNDACVALAQYLAGSETEFAKIMNEQAQSLGMIHSHFTDSTGLPHPRHYTTPYDMALLARALIHDFPQYYHFYKQKWFTYNGIKQMNRNRLLWRDKTVDGLKTGHTDQAGYCLIASAKRQDTRLISVVMNTPSERARAVTSEQLLNYGFRFYETKRLYQAQTPLIQPRVWYGTNKQVAFGLAEDLLLTIPRTQTNKLQVLVQLPPHLQAPIKQGEVYGSLQLRLDDQILAERPLIALADDPKGSLWSRLKDHTHLTVDKFLHRNQTESRTKA